MFSGLFTSHGLEPRTSLKIEEGRGNVLEILVVNAVFIQYFTLGKTKLATKRNASGLVSINRARTILIELTEALLWHLFPRNGHTD